MVPETGYFSESGRASLPGDTRTAIRSVQGGAPKRYLWWPTGESRALQSLCVRHYDSHLSVYAYFMLARAVLIRLLGSLGAPFSIELEPRRYVGDLAQRFSDRRIVGHFISEKYLVNEMLMPSGNRGIVKSYSNVDAPVRKRLLLLGDSHSYSAMAPACSYYFSEVSFIWANKVDSYSPREALVEELWAAADFVVEESAERFFIANLCEAVN